MAALKQLSGLYIAAASAYAVAIVLSQHPVLVKRIHAGTNYLAAETHEAQGWIGTELVRPGARLVIQGSRVAGRGLADGARWIRVAGSRLDAQIQSVLHRGVLAKDRALRSWAPHAPRPQPKLRLEWQPSGMPRAEPALRVAQSRFHSESRVHGAAPEHPAARAHSLIATVRDRETTTLPRFVPPAAEPPVPSLNVPPLAPAELVQVEKRLKENLTTELYNNFDLFLYVSKASSGPWAQQMYVFQKQQSGDLALLYHWPVSTGREQVEYSPAGVRTSSNTPAGYYELDPKRLYQHHFSVEWEEPMPFAMFFNWVNNGRPTGLAIHAATGSDISALGSRASAGCIRLSPESARTLFTLIRSQYRGLAPRFAFDRRTGTMSNDGILLHDPSGKLQLAEGYKVLVFIENYGGENVVAAMF